MSTEFVLVLRRVHSERTNDFTTDGMITRIIMPLSLEGTRGAGWRFRLREYVPPERRNGDCIFIRTVEIATDNEDSYLVQWQYQEITKAVREYCRHPRFRSRPWELIEGGYSGEYVPVPSTILEQNVRTGSQKTSALQNLAEKFLTDQTDEDPEVTPGADLWPKDLNVQVQSPLAILRTQAETLGERTRGRILGEVVSTIDSLGTTHLHAFDVVASLINSRRTILKTTHSIDLVYPVTVVSDGLRSTDDDFGDEEAQVSAESEKEFIRIVAQIFRSRYTRSVLESLMARCNEVPAVPSEGMG